MNRQLNLPLQFRYNHMEKPPVLKDVRKKPLLNIQQDHVYFLGFRISAKTGDIYHHAMIIADDDDAFFDGIAGEYNTIMDQHLVTFRADITLIYVRNLMMLDPELIAEAEEDNIITRAQEYLSKRDDGLFTVFGLIGERNICLMPVASQNGLLALEAARNKVRQQYGEEFMPLELCQAHPIRHEFNAMFLTEVERFKSLVDEESTGSGYVH